MGEWNQRLTDLGRTETRANGVEGQRILGQTNLHSEYLVVQRFVTL